MQRQELINKVAEQTGATKVQTTLIIETAISAMADALIQGDEVTLRGFGTFKPSERAARVGRNPSTGESIEIPAKNSVKFKAGTLLTAALNGK